MGAKPDLPVWSLSLGCPKNRVDTEKLLGSLDANIIPAEDINHCRLVLINTCAFIEPATRESIRAILDAAAEIKNARPRPLLAVAGCMVGRYGAAELAREIPEADLWLATKEMEEWPGKLGAALGLDANGLEGRCLSTGPAYAWLKIGEGCRHKCAFCAIPSIRGPLRSESGAKILAEAENLLAAGVRELNLVAQDLTSWGRDFVEKPSDNRRSPKDLPQLLASLAELRGLEWLRLLYLYPDSISDGLLRLMAEIGPPILPYLDIPLQHVEADILRKMGRPFKTDARRLLERVRGFLPEAALRGTLIVGFPGETEKHFRNLRKFVEEARFQHLGIFTYYAEEGTPAASLPDQVADELKEERKAELMDIQAEISRENLEKYVGGRQKVLVEAPQGEWPGLYVGRVWFQAPEVDGLTYVSGPGVRPGAMIMCDIENSHDYDLDALAAMP